MGDVLLPGFKFGGAEGTAVVVEGSEIFQVDLEQIAWLANLPAGNTGHPADARLARSRGRRPSRLLDLRRKALRDLELFLRRSFSVDLFVVVVFVVVALFVVFFVVWKS
jgi:hypothetical protein